MKYLPRTSSNHSPMCIEVLQDRSFSGPSQFRFQRMWTSHDDFLPLVSRVWDSNMNRNALNWVARNLFELKLALKM